LITKEKQSASRATTCESCGPREELLLRGRDEALRDPCERSGEAIGRICLCHPGMMIGLREDRPMRRSRRDPTEALRRPADPRLVEALRRLGLVLLLLLLPRVLLRRLLAACCSCCCFFLAGAAAATAARGVMGGPPICFQRRILAPCTSSNSRPLNARRVPGLSDLRIGGTRRDRFGLAPSASTRRTARMFALPNARRSTTYRLSPTRSFWPDRMPAASSSRLCGSLLNARVGFEADPFELRPAEPRLAPDADLEAFLEPDADLEADREDLARGLGPTTRRA
jgi:hypothetical protein